MTYPIEVPPELFAEWWAERVKQHGFGHYGLATGFVARKAAEWAADQQLEKCCEWLTKRTTSKADADQLRAAMRPKPPSLKEQAAEELRLLRDEMKRHGLNAPVTPALASAIDSMPDES